MEGSQEKRDGSWDCKVGETGCVDLPVPPPRNQVPCNGLTSNPGGSGITIILHFRLE